MSRDYRVQFWGLVTGGVFAAAFSLRFAVWQIRHPHARKVHR